MITLDERGRQCPLPVVEAKRALENAAGKEGVAVTVDNQIAVQNLQKMAAHRGFCSDVARKGEREWVVKITSPGEENTEAPMPKKSEEIQKEDAAGAAGRLDEPEQPGNKGIRKGMVAVISADGMGMGDEKLAGILMKGFLYALSRQDRLPETVLLYNGGARLSCEGSDSLEDLQLMAQAGVEILTCGTCLDFYGLKDRLRVGEVTNMYEIVERQTEAMLVIRP